MKKEEEREREETRFVFRPTIELSIDVMTNLPIPRMKWWNPAMLKRARGTMQRTVESCHTFSLLCACSARARAY